MSISDIQKQLRDAVELACQELEWHGNRDGGEALSHLKALAFSCGCEAKTAGEMCKAIADHIDWLAGQCKDNRVEPCGEPIPAQVTYFSDCECFEPQPANVTITPLEVDCPPVLEDRVDELTDRVAELEERSSASPTSPDSVLDVTHSLEADVSKMNQRIAALNDRVSDCVLKGAKRMETLEYNMNLLAKRLAKLSAFTWDGPGCVGNRMDEVVNRVSALEERLRGSSE